MCKKKTHVFLLCFSKVPSGRYKLMEKNEDKEIIMQKSRAAVKAKNSLSWQEMTKTDEKAGNTPNKEKGNWKNTTDWPDTEIRQSL